MGDAEEIGKELARGTCGLLGAAITFHAIYNLLIAYGGAAQYIAYLLPVLILTVGKLLARRLTP